MDGGKREARSCWIIHLKSPIKKKVGPKTFLTLVVVQSLVPINIYMYVCVCYNLAKCCINPVHLLSAISCSDMLSCKTVEDERKRRMSTSFMCKNVRTWCVISAAGVNMQALQRGGGCCFQAQFEQMVHPFAVRGNTCTRFSRLSCWITLLLPELVFTGRGQLRFLLASVCK